MTGIEFESLALFFRGSYKRMALWTSAAQSVPNYNSSTRLKLIGQTRWSAKQDAVSNVMKSNLHLFVVIKALVQMCNVADIEKHALTTACHLLHSFTKYETVIALFVLHEVFSELTPITAFLQTSGLNLIDAAKSIRTFYDTISEFEIDDAIITKAENFIGEVNYIISGDVYISSTDTAVQIQIPSGSAKLKAVRKCQETFRSFIDTMKKEIQTAFLDDLVEMKIFTKKLHI